MSDARLVEQLRRQRNAPPLLINGRPCRVCCPGTAWRPARRCHHHAGIAMEAVA